VRVFKCLNISKDHEPSPDLVAQLASEVYRTDLLQLLVLNIQKFEFEVYIYVYIYKYINNWVFICFCVDIEISY
jgi:hypothetical protein